ncbi:MAG: MBL fold metallo-hydrolase [Acidobacteriota bacterium]|nr:MBL fold metallo-hydrolase [Acidobacteriota bacterium]
MGRLELPGYDAVGIRAANPGPLTLTGTNTWIYGRDPAWLIDPGPALGEHLDAISEEIDARGGLGAVLLTHDHIDHAEAVPEIVSRFSPVPLAAARGTVSTLLADGSRFGPFEVVASPGHAPDHLSFVAGDLAFTGDAVLGEGSVFVTGQLAEYLGALRVLQAMGLSVIAPGHGPVVLRPDLKLAQYIDHRLAREEALVTALAEGKRTKMELLDAAWSDVPAQLRPAAALTLEAHLEKLDHEGRLPEGLQRGGGPAGPTPAEH